MTCDTLTPLPDLSAKLRQMTGDPGPGYRKLHQLALDGLLPTEKRNNRRYIRDCDIPALIELLGLASPTSQDGAE